MPTFIALALHGAALAAQTGRVDEDSGAILVGVVRSLLHGQALPNAFVSLESLRSSNTAARAFARSDSAGHYQIRVPAGGEYLLQAQAMVVEAGGKVRVPVHLRGHDTARIDLFIPPLEFDLARREAQLDELSKARTRWAERGPDAYRVNIHWECFCLGGGAGDWALEVQPETTLVLRRPKYGGDRPPAAKVERLFEWLETELRDPGRTVEVRYDSRLGYPTHIDTDTVFLLTDMWTKVEVLGLRAIPR